MLKLIPYNSLHFPALLNDPLVFVIHIPEFSSQLGKYSSYLNQEEITRAGRYVQLADKERFIIARGCLKEIIAHYLGKDAQANSVVFKANQYGKLFLENHSLYFNVSHTHEKILIAVSAQHEVGVDIEYQQREMEYLDLAKRFFHPEEHAYLTKQNEEDLRSAFFAIWSAKEAVIKCLGVGLTQELNQFSVLPALTDQEAIIHVNGRAIKVFTKTIENYSLALGLSCFQQSATLMEIIS